MQSEEAVDVHTFLRRAERNERRYLNPVPTTVGGWSTFRDALPQYLNNKEEKTPRTPLGPFRTDATLYGVSPASGLRVTWMGHSTLLIEIDGFRILTDPVWDLRASPLRWAGPKRFFPAPLPLAQVPRLDAVLVSHDHYDHLGETSVRNLARLPHLRDTKWITALGVGDVLHQYGVRKQQIHELDWTDTHLLASPSGTTLEITAIPSRHFSGRSIFNRFETLWSSFVLQGPHHKIYFGADSGWWPGFAEIGKVHGPFDLTMLEIGAYNDLWQDIHLGPEGATRAFMDMGGAGLFMPIHWGLFDLALHGWRQPIERLLELADEKQVKIWSPSPGEPSEVAPSVELRSDWWR